ncbi:MAG: alpha/beta hydrolase, partial [Solobacterium sp.]|nr:alpha/beta hydrolase [Solobacterium sp.]
ARTLILAGSNDAVKEKETLQIAEGVPNATLRIIDGETHGSYIVHSRKIADLLAGWLSQK